jgi:hypothetical protein
MAFKLGSRNSKPTHIGGVKLVTTPLDKGTIAEARNDGTIVVSPDVDPKSALMKRVVKHEMKHIEQMKDGRSQYGDNWVMWEDKIYIRKNGMIDGPNGRLPEGHKDHPWEQEAIAAEKE